ncbi:MAG: gluconokinase [Spirochaetales bacterium]|nr:gluconokinase [Spirochaetales bacterium]
MILIVMGVSGCGKSTVGAAVAQKLNWEFQDADDYHPPQNIAKMRQGIPLQDSDREGWLLILAALIREHEELKKPLILACSALKQAYRQVLITGPEVKLVYLEGSLETIAKRLANREGHFMNPRLLESQFAILEPPSDALVLDVDLGLESQVEAICAYATPKPHSLG